MLPFSHSVTPTLCDPMECSTPRLPCPSPSPGVCANSWQLSWKYHSTISSSVVPFSCLESFSASGSFPVSQLFASSGRSIGASASASVIPMNIQGLFPLGLTGLIPFCPRGSQESSPAPQFERINSSALSLYGPLLTSVHDYWKNHSIGHMDLCWQSDAFAF